MTAYVDTYCPACDEKVHARLHDQPATLTIRGEQIDFTETVAVCPTCHNPIGDARIEGPNLERAYDAYRKRHGILSPKEVRALRESYGLSLREFSKFLGFGEQTAYRYEHGDLPDQPHNTLMLSAGSIDGAKLLLSQNGHRLSDRSVASIKQRIQSLAAGTATESRRRRTLEDGEADGPSAANGYRSLDLDRVAALVHALASKCHDLYWTKLQKAMFFADMACFERFSRSLTGLSYAHATFGPVVDHKDEMRYLLVNRETIAFRECGWGEVLVPLQPCGQPFSTDEQALIDEVARFVDTFSTAGELSDFSHKLGCWTNTVDGETIEYTRGNGEVCRAMHERMSERGK